MKNRSIVILLLLLLCTTVLGIFHVAAAEDVTLTLSDSELGTQFAYEWGPGTLTAVTDISGPGVRFDFTGLTGSGTGVGDNYPVSQLAGGALDNIGGYGDFRAYTQYRLVFTNLGPCNVSVNVMMNTGWTASDWKRDTYWENGWVFVEVGKSKVVTLDFSSAICWNAQDDPNLAWQYPGGTSGVIVRRLDEVSHLGFQICGSSKGSIIVSATTPSLTLTLSDSELGTQFAYEWGPGTLTAITDIAGPGVKFDFTGLNTSSGTGVGDNFPVNQLAGGAWKDYGSGLAGPYNFSIYSRYSMMFTNNGTTPVMVCLKINTGWTSPPWGSPARDTYWQSQWTSVDAGETVVVTLEFSGAIVYNAGDDPNPSWQYTDGTVHPVHRIDEVSDVGFQILGNGTGSIIVTRIVDVTLTLLDAELSTQFGKETGPGTLTTVTDIPGPGVKFDFTGLSTSSGTVVGDNFPVSPLAGGAWKDYGSGFAGPYDFSAYTRYMLVFTNVGTKSVTVNLKMNTGWTASPWGSAARDTFWQNSWTSIAPNESRVVTLDFWSAEVWNAADDPVSAWQYPDGTTGVIVRRLNELSDIGFQILGDGEGSIVVTNVFEAILTLSDAELSTQFGKETGPGTLTAVTDIAGPGVRFDFTGLQLAQGTVVGDNFPVSSLAGGAYKTYGVTNPFSTWGDFSAYTKYVLVITNIGAKPVTVNLKINTGWTIPPPEYAAAWRDTFWQNTWTYIEPNKSKVITLDFSSAEVYNAGDEQEFTPYPDGTTGVAVWRLDEVSDIGFQILGNSTGSIIVSGFGYPPTASFTYSPISPKAGETVTFNASGSTANGDTMVSYQWNFGDGNVTTISNPVITHVYGSPATYNVTLTVTDSEGFTDMTWQLLTVVSAIKHDISILNVTTSTPHEHPGRIVNITVTVKNNGEASETFNVTAYRDSIPIGTILVTNLGVGENLTLIFQWNTSGLTPCHTWTINATAPLPGDVNLSDNTFSDGTVKITMLNDINQDGIINIVDIVIAIVAFGTRPGDPKWNPDVDLNSDNRIDIVDIVMIAIDFGKTCP